jgi:hypothetical protein
MVYVRATGVFILEYSSFIIFPVVPNWNIGAFSGFMWSHTIRHAVGLLCTSDQLVTETSTYAGQHNRQTSMSWAWFELAISATKRPQTYALDRAATEIGILEHYFLFE